MKKQNLLNILILVTAVLSSTVKAFCYAEVEQMVYTSVQPAVAIEKTASLENGSINAETGTHTGLSASFKIQTNGTNDEIIVGSKINTLDGGTVSAYTTNGDLLFANTSVPPTISAVDNAKTGDRDNRNVIAYPITMSITDPMSVKYDRTKTTDEGTGCYVITINSANEGTLTQNVGGTPVPNTYSIGQDQAGTYKVTVYLTTVNK